MNLSKKSVLITGGSIGIGLELAKKMLNAGANVLVCARNEEALDKAKRDYPRLETAQCDVTQEGQVQALLQHMKQLFGGVDIIINNAAVFRRFHVLEDYPLESQLEEININLKGPVIVTNVFLKVLLKKSVQHMRRSHKM